MNGRKAKQLRRLAGVTKENRDSRSYAGENVRIKEVTHPTFLNPDGTPLVTHRYQTATYVLNQSCRKLYKQLKKACKQKQGIFA